MLLTLQINCFAYNSTITFSEVSGQAQVSLWPRNFDLDVEVEQICKQYLNMNTYLSIKLDSNTLQSEVMIFNYNQTYVIDLHCLQDSSECIREMKTLNQLQYSFLFNSLNSEITATISAFSMEFMNHEKCFSEVYIVPDLVLGVYTITFPQSYPCQFEQVDVDIQMHIYPNLIWTHRVKNYNQSLVQFSGLAVECIDQSYSYQKCVDDVYDVYFASFFSGFIRLVTYNKEDPSILSPNLQKYETIIQQNILGIRAVSYKNFYKSLNVSFQDDKIHFINTLLNYSAFNTTEVAFLTLCVQEFSNYTGGKTWVFEQQIQLFDFYQTEFWIDCNNATNIQECKDDIKFLQYNGQNYIYNLQVAFMYYNFTLMEVYFDEAKFQSTCINAASLLRKDNQFCLTIIYLEGCVPMSQFQLVANLFISNEQAAQYNISLQSGEFFNTSMEIMFPSDFCYPPDNYQATFNNNTWGILNYAGYQIPISQFSVEQTKIVQWEGISCLIASVIAAVGGFYLALNAGPKNKKVEEHFD